MWKKTFPVWLNYFSVKRRLSHLWFARLLQPQMSCFWSKTKISSSIPISTGHHLTKHKQAPVTISVNIGGSNWRPAGWPWTFATNATLACSICPCWMFSWQNKIVIIRTNFAWHRFSIFHRDNDPADVIMDIYSAACRSLCQNHYSSLISVA